MHQSEKEISQFPSLSHRTEKNKKNLKKKISLAKNLIYIQAALWKPNSTK